MEEIYSKIDGLKGDFVCTECNHKQVVNVLQYVNFNKNPEYYSLVKDLSIFKVKCEHCGAEKLIKYNLLLVDETHNYFLFFLSDRTLENRFKYQITYFVETVLNKDDKYDLDKCKTRLVFELNDIIEKMTIFELGLDDEAIELLKYSLLDKGLVDDPAYDCVYFDGMKDADLVFCAISSKTSTKEPIKISIRPKIYNKIVDDLANFKNRHHDLFEVIDQNWVREKFEKNK